MFWRRRWLARRVFLGGLFWRRFVFGSFVILALGGLAYKIHVDDVRRIEECSSKKAENMSEAELAASMKKLGISKLELTEDERKQVKESYVE